MTPMLLIRTLVSSRPDLSGYKDITTAYKISFKSLARRYIKLHDEIADIDVMMNSIVDELAPELVKQKAIGQVTASQLLITLGDNPERMKSEASFEALWGVSLTLASSGKTNRHRLNRGGDRAANSTLQIIAIGKFRTDKKTNKYIEKHTSEGLSKMEIIGCLKRYIAIEVYHLLKNRQSHINSTKIID
jgi:transposase